MELGMDDRTYIKNEDYEQSLVQDYYTDVKRDFSEVKEEYPFSYLTILPTIEPKIAIIHAVAAHRDLIESCHAVEEDLKGHYSKELLISIPVDYMKKGCNVYGGAWIDLNQIPYKHRHVHPVSGEYKKYGYEFCVGVPDSFLEMSNVILENIRTAEHLLISYENYLCGNTKTIEIVEYSHGDKGIREYANEQNNYKGNR